MLTTVAKLLDSSDIFELNLMKNSELKSKFPMLNVLYLLLDEKIR